MSLAGCVRTSVIKVLDTGKVVNDLRSGTADKISAWNKLKVFSISRSAAIIYANTMLVATMRVQLNLMGAYMFKNTQQPLTAGNLDEVMQQRYLTLCSYFLDEGIERLSSFIEKKVSEAVSTIKLTDQMSIRDLEQVYRAIMATILTDKTGDPIRNLASYMLPSKIEEQEEPLLKQMIIQTLDLLESEELRDLMQSSIRQGFVMLIDKISEYFIDVPSTDKLNNGINNDTELKNGRFLDINKITMPMAKIIPIINGQVPDVAIQNDVPAEWLQRLIMDGMLKSFGANVYEAFSF
uniref:Peroxisomal biogenesis factor 3 n=1 Tax=Bracon brevicornis TaxID=1563983 RepID=A0A6V7JZZ0_9HYME